MAAASANSTKPLQRNPLKLFANDIYRATNTEDKYIYEIFGMKFKNVMLHGLVTSVYSTNASNTATNFDLTDPTGRVSIYYDTTKNNCNIPRLTYKDLIQDFAAASRRGNDNAITMSKLLSAIEKKQLKPICFSPGDCVSVVGDIFVDNLTDKRMVSAYECRLTSFERDIIWMEELPYLYQKFYLSKEE